MRVSAGLLTLQGKTANITSRNIALKRCISAEVIVSKQRPVLADLPPAALPLLGRFLQTQTDSFNDVSAVRHQPHHQDARIEATGGDSTVDHRLFDWERKRKALSRRAALLRRRQCLALVRGKMRERGAERSGGEAQRLEGDCCACKVQTLGAARPWTPSRRSSCVWRSQVCRCVRKCVRKLVPLSPSLFRSLLLFLFIFILLSHLISSLTNKLS